MLLSASSASAHVVVRPSEVPVGAFQTFTVSVPSEKDIPTAKIRLVIPDGLEYFTPTVKPGWKVDVVTHEINGEKHPVEVIWSGGSVPGHFRDDFTFSARVPATSTALTWKAYQSYSDGSVVAWELASESEQPKKNDGSPDFSTFGPASQTKIVDDLSYTSTPIDSSMAVSVVALLISLASFAVGMKRKK